MGPGPPNVGPVYVGCFISIRPSRTAETETSDRRHRYRQARGVNVLPGGGNERTQMGTGIRAEVSLSAAAPSPFDGVIDGATPIYSVARCAPNGDSETVVLEFIADADLSVLDEVEVVFDYGAKAAYRFEAPCVEESPFAILDRHGVPVSEATIRDGRLLVTFHAADLPTLRSVLDEFRECCADMQVLRLLQSSSTPEESDLVTVDRSGLTERQREVLSAAYDAGYFDHPKGANAGEVAASLDIDRSTFSEHIAAAQRKLLSTILD